MIHSRRVTDSVVRVWVIVAALALANRSQTAEPPTAESSPPAAPDGVDGLVRSLLVANLPLHYENTKRWGQTKPRWDGVQIWFDDWRLETKRLRKDANHGTWTRYDATLIDPERQLAIRFANLRETPDRRAAFDLTVDAKLALTGRLSEWRSGVQLYSFSAEADAKVRLTMTCEVGLTFDAAQFPPDVLLAPRVTAAALDLQEFELHRISAAGGPIVRKFGDGLREILQDELNDRRQKLVDKINRAIEKRRDRLRLSVHDLATAGFGKFVGEPPKTP